MHVKNRRRGRRRGRARVSGYGDAALPCTSYLVPRTWYLVPGTRSFGQRLRGAEVREEIPHLLLVVIFEQPLGHDRSANRRQFFDFVAGNDYALTVGLFQHHDSVVLLDDE